MSNIENLMHVSITVSVHGKPASPDFTTAADICGEEVTLNLGAGADADGLAATLNEIATAAQEGRLYGWMAQEIAEMVATDDIVPLTIADYAAAFEKSEGDAHA